MHTGPRAQINEVVSFTNGCFVVFHNQDRIAQVPEVFQRVDQFLIVSLMETYGRFIQHIQHAAQGGTDLRSKADALGLAPTEGGTAAIKGQVIQPDITQKRESAANLFQDLVGDLLLALSQGQLLEETIRFLDRQPSRLHDVQVVDGDGKSFLTEAVAMTDRTDFRGLEAVHPHLDLHAVRLIVPTLQIRNDSGKRLFNPIGLARLLPGILNENMFFRPIENRLDRLFFQISEGSIQGELEMFCKSLELGAGPLGIGVHGSNGAFVEAFRVVGNHQVGIEFRLNPQAVALRTCTKRIVETKKPGFQFRHGDSAMGAAVALTVNLFMFLIVVTQKGDLYQALGHLDAGLNTRNKTSTDFAL